MKNSNAVAAERRMDLASLFCMIGRHGPAVALVVLALASVLAGFLIYRTVRGKRRKATAADSDGKSPGAERDTSAIQPSPEEPHGSTAESTEVSDEGSSDVKEDVGLIQSDLKVRHRRAAAAAAAAERKHPSSSPPKSDIQAQDDKHSASGDTEEMAAARDSCKVAETREEGASQSLQGDTYTVAEMAAEEAVDRRRGAPEDVTEDVTEEVHGNDSCLVEPELVHDEDHEEEEKVLKAEWEEDVTADKDVSDKKTRQEEETPHMSESDDDDDGLQDNKTILETSSAKSTSGERVTRIEDVPASCISQGKDEEFGEENPDGLANVTFSDTERLPPEAEAEVESVDSQLTAQQAKTCSSPSERETSLPSTQQDHCDHVTDRVTPATRDSAVDEDGVPAGEVMEEVVDDDHLNALTAIKAATHPPQFDKQEVEIEQMKESAPTCEQEDAILCVGADAEKDKMLTSDNIACSEECEGSSVAPRPALPCWSVPVTVDTQSDVSSPGEESGISSMAVSPDLQDVGNGFDMTVENMALPVMDYDVQSEGKTEAQNSLFADDAAVSVASEDAAGMVFGPPHREHTDWTNSESYAANEDVFGHDVENSYHRMIDQLMTAIAARVTSFTDELEKQTDMEAAVEVVEIKEKEAGVSAEKGAETKAEQGDEEGYEKTEISIMEATMDNNEWITDSNYQALPWMNLSAPAFAQDHTKNTQLPTEECPDTTCIDATDIPLSAQVKQTSALCLVDENSESHKKVVAVQPLPQTVNVTFSVNYFTQSPYQTVAVTGSQQELGNWKEFIPLERAKEGHWATVVSLPAESHVEWKFVVVDKGEVCRWEECGNRLLDTGFGDDLLVHKWWGLL